MNFMFHYCYIIGKWCKENTNNSSFPSVNMTALRKLEIFLPPLEKQKEIAKILDTFDTLVNSISEGLPKEIALRRKQYEYYRDKLLSFS